MKILLFGAMGQLGTELQQTLSPFGEVAAFDIHNLDLENTREVRETIHRVRPDVIVNASAYTAVDQAEREAEQAFKINGDIPGLFAEEASKINAFLIHYSTDYVFDGTKGRPYIETDAPNPLNVYGKSKLIGEQAIRSENDAYLILRTAWVYSTRRDSFVSKVLQWARQNEALKIVNDQISNPTWARMLAQTTAMVLARTDNNLYSWLAKHKGIYHLAGDGFTSRLEWARKILELDPLQEEHVYKKILPAITNDFPTPAQRPLFSALDCALFEKTFNLKLPNWQDTLQLAIS